MGPFLSSFGNIYILLAVDYDPNGWKQQFVLRMMLI